MSDKIEMPPNVQAFINKRGSRGSDEENAAFWKEFRKAANAYADVQASRICTAEHKIATLGKQLDEMTEQRDKLVEALQEILDNRHGAFVRAKRLLTEMKGASHERTLL